MSQILLYFLDDDNAQNISLNGRALDENVIILNFSQIFLLFVEVSSTKSFFVINLSKFQQEVGVATISIDLKIVVKFNFDFVVMLALIC